VDKGVLTGQGERSDAAPAGATAATPAAVTATADPAAVSATPDGTVASTPDGTVACAADPAALEAAADSPPVADATAVPGAAPVAPAAGTAEVPARAGAPRWANLPYAIVLAAVAGGLAWVAMGGLRHVQAGMLAVASALLAAALLRLVLPERAAGLLVSRRRVLDVLTLVSLGAGIMAAVLVLPAP
jgi:Protein of unknown function (DUF3017)